MVSVPRAAWYALLAAVGALSAWAAADRLRVEPLRQGAGALREEVVRIREDLEAARRRQRALEDRVRALERARADDPGGKP
jgi:hypothetical protein